MRCGRFLAKVRSVLALIAFASLLVPLIILLNRRPAIVGRSYRPVNFRVDTRIPGGFLKGYAASNRSYCKFNYGLPTRFGYEEEDVRYGPELGERGAYRVLYNVIEATARNLPPVTYASHATSEFVNYVAEIAVKWEGPVSVAVFAPDADGETAAGQLVALCRCLPEMARVSVHFVYPARHPPYVSATPGAPAACAPRDLSGRLTFRSRNRLPYPVNVCRNSAKAAAATPFVLVSDVELVPSGRLASRFLAMVAGGAGPPAAVYVVPVFEIERHEAIPATKAELLELVRDEKAVYFHRHVCFHCQKFPGLQDWLQNEPGDVVKPLTVVKREYPFHRWEPIYIGHATDPLYSEALSWEGKQDKMTQMLEMCLIGYKFVILDGAFLVHWPGIKRKSIEMKIRNKWRSPYLRQNSRQYSIIINDLFNKHKARNAKC